MSTFSLTKGSAAALGMLTIQAGSETLLLTQPARELRAELSIEPFTGDSGEQLLAVLFMREQRHSMTLQRNDGANVQHLADWVEAVANGTLDTAQAIPQRQPVLLPCCRCEGVAIAYSYLAPAPAQHDLHGVKCRHRDCQSLEGATTAAAAADAWNDIQREELAEAAEPAPAQDERELPDYLNDAIDNLVHDNYERSQAGSRNRQADADLIRAALATRPAQTEQQPVAINPDPPELMIRWHESPESVHRAMWDSVAIREGMTYDELLAEGVTCGFDESGNEVEMEAGADIEGMRMQGCWAFVDTLNSCIHAWAAPDTDRGLVLHMLAHEIGHASGTPHPDGFQEEMRAEQFGRVAAAAYSMLLDKDRPQCTAPACGCADAYCMAWPDEATRPAQAEQQPEQSGLVEALAEAAQSLETISNGAGKDEFMQDMADVRGYARGRAGIARAALASAPTA